MLNKTNNTHIFKQLPVEKQGAYEKDPAHRPK